MNIDRNVTIDVMRKEDLQMRALQKQENGQTQNYYWDTQVTFAKDGANAHTYLQDELGSPIRLTGGQTTEAYAWDEFAQNLCGDLAQTQPFGYTGYIPDPAAGTYFAQAREYMPQTGRFTAEDNRKGHILFPETQNPYIYCWNSPQNHIDPDGNFPLSSALLGTTGIYTKGVIERGITAVTQAQKTGNPKLISRYVVREIAVNPVSSLAANHPIGPVKDVFGLAGFENKTDDAGNKTWQTKFNCWQQHFGYNDLYDKVFDVGTRMKFDKFEFQYQGEEHMIWAWRGDYLNLGAGAELGIYSQTFIPGHYRTRPDLGIPMKLGLMDKNGNMIIQRGASDNWWVTGFNPRYLGANPAELTAIYTLDFSQHPDMFEAFYKKYGRNRHWIFDRATCTAVFIFGGGSIDA